MLNLVICLLHTRSFLTAERIRMDVISQNIANVNTTHGPDGKPYQRQHVVFETVLQQQQTGETNGAADLVQVPGIGPRTAQAIIAKLGDDSHRD